MNMFIGNKQLKKYISTGICTFYYSDIFYKTNTHFCFFFACGKKTYSQCEKTKNLELVLFSPFTSDTRYMCEAKK